MWNGKKKGPSGADGTTSIIDESCHLSGKLDFNGTLMLAGKFTGEIHSSDTLLVGETGDVEADVHVGRAIVSGKITGNITARDRIVLHSCARVTGDLKAPSLVLEEGAVLDGRCNTKAETPRVVEKLPLKQQAHG